MNNLHTTIKQFPSGFTFYSGSADYLNGRKALVNVAKGRPIYQNIPAKAIHMPTTGLGWFLMANPNTQLASTVVATYIKG